VATTLLTELTDPKKSTSNYINDGLLAFNNLTDAEKKALLGMRANNVHQQATLPLSLMCCAILAEYQFRLDITRISKG
jgi:hypothetical protein